MHKPSLPSPIILLPTATDPPTLAPLPHETRTDLPILPNEAKTLRVQPRREILQHDGVVHEDLLVPGGSLAAVGIGSHARLGMDRFGDLRG